MSLNINQLPVVQTIYPKTNINNQRSYSILRGSTETSYQQFPSTSFNNSQVQWTANPPSNSTIVDRLFWIKKTFRLVFAGSGSGALLQIGANDAIRCLPIATITNTIQVTLNNDQVSTNLNQYWSALSHYHSDLCNRNTFLDKTPAFQDKSQEYSDLASGSIRNPLGPYTASADGQTLRGAFPINVVSNGNTSAEVIFTVTEPCFLSPFIFSEFDYMKSGLIGVNNLSVTMTLGNLARLWSHSSNGNTITSITPSLLSATLLFCYYSPNIAVPIPTKQSWEYFEIIPYPTQNGNSLAPSTMATSNTTTMTMNSVQLKQHPNKIYIYAREADAYLDGTITPSDAWTKTDTFAAIKSISITYGNRTGLLATASTEDLYEMSRKNGLCDSYREFFGLVPIASPAGSTGPANVIGTVGSVVCVCPGQDLGLDALSAPGLMQNVQLSVNCTFINPNQSRSIVYALYVVVVNEGVINFMNGSFTHQVGVFSSADVLAAEKAPMVKWNVYRHVYGGNFWDKVKSFFNKVGQTVAPALPYVVPVARKLLGVGKKPRAGVLIGGRKRRSRKSKGGKMMSRSELENRLGY